ncbi:MAG TPA: tetratricopeptide repeat protein, partial [Acidobacteriota bacterium]
MRHRNILILFAILIFVGGCKSDHKPDQNALLQIFVHRNLGLGYLEESRLSEAQKEFQTLIASVPDEAMPHANLGLAYLRNNDLTHAESELKQAIKLDPKNPDIRLIFAEVLSHAGRNKEALDQLQQGLQVNPKHLRCNYRAAEIFMQEGKAGASIKTHLENVLSVMPSSLPARLELTEILLEQKDFAAVTHQLEEIRRMVPAMSPDASKMLQELLMQLRTDKSSNANVTLRMLHNTLKPSPLYQQSITELKGLGGSLIGFPIMDFSDGLTKQLTAENVMLRSLQFVKADPFGTISGNSQPIAADLDSDGDQDLIIPQPFSVFKNDRGKFIDVTSKTGIK